MEQVAANHGDGIAEIRALCVDDLLQSHRAIQLPKSFQDFYDFPAQCGWHVRDDFTVVASTELRQEHSLPFLLQAWLFFGLIFTVVQKDQKPVLTFDDLRNDKFLSTKKLHDAIDKWTNWEDQNRDRSRFRMIQVGWVLDLAREVLRKRYAYDYGTDVDSHDEPDFHMSDKSVLVLMCLGETLSAAKARIVEQNAVGTGGWHGDDHAGWGPPRYIFNRMKQQGWCPRAIEILRGQVRSNATMLVAAYQAYQKSSRMTTREHKDAECTKDECKVKSLDEKGKYRNRHIDKCSGKCCDPCGPVMKEVIAVLQREDNSIPLVEFCDDDTGRQFKVISFNPDIDTRMKFVTISHVWSDGWGNTDENKLNRCQVDFIRRQIRRATGSRHTPFWMDTLVVPVAKEAKEFRKKAIRQIFDVFAESTHTIILDNGLSAMDRGGPDKPAEAAMKIFSSVWMQRLWTLQEAYLSRRIVIPFEEDSSETDNLMSFDGIEDELERFMKRSSAGITRMVKDQLSRMIMGEERKRDRTGADKRKEMATTVANTYRAARWRVSRDSDTEQLARLANNRQDDK